MVRLICEDITLEQKKYLWEVVTIEHFSGSHEHCVPHGATAQWRFCREADRAQALKEFLMLTSKYLDKCGRLISTQMNESPHAMKAHCANKLSCWGRSWSARVCVAKLQANEPVSWKFELHRLLRLPELCFESPLRLLAMAHEDQADRERRRTPEFRKRENARRKTRKKSASVSEARCSDYTYHASTRREASSEDETEEDEEELTEAAIRDVDQWTPEVPVDDCNIQDSEDDDHGAIMSLSAWCRDLLSGHGRPGKLNTIQLRDRTLNAFHRIFALDFIYWAMTSLVRCGRSGSDWESLLSRRQQQNTQKTDSRRKQNKHKRKQTQTKPKIDTKQNNKTKTRQQEEVGQVPTVSAISPELFKHDL